MRNGRDRTPLWMLVLVAAKLAHALDAEEELSVLFRDSSQAESRPRNVLMRLKNFVRHPFGTTDVDYKPSKTEIREFLKEEDFNMEKALKRLTDKREWKSKLGPIQMREDIAPCLRSNGLSCLYFIVL